MKRNVFLIIFFLVFCGLFVWYGTQSTTLFPSEDTSLTEQDTQPSPLPFAELTIPYLRQKEYSSQLGELEPYQDNADYTSFLTSYTSEGLRINALLTKPKGEQPEGGWPAIVFVHGYIPPTQYKTTEKYQAYTNYLARNGFVVFKIDLRGHGQSEGEAGGAYYSSDYIVDTLSAYAALRTLDVVDGDAIGLWGHSMAGNVVLRSMAAQPGIPAGVIWAGAVYTYSDFQELGLSDNSYRPPAQLERRQSRREALFSAHGQFSPDSEFWKQVAPANYLNDLKGSIQLHHAVNDNVVSVEYSRGLKKLLEQTSVPHEFYEYSGGGHNISAPHFSPAMQRTVEFFKQKLK